MEQNYFRFQTYFVIYINTSIALASHNVCDCVKICKDAKHQYKIRNTKTVEKVVLPTSVYQDSHEHNHDDGDDKQNSDFKNYFG